MIVNCVAINRLLISNFSSICACSDLETSSCFFHFFTKPSLIFFLSPLLGNKVSVLCCGHTRSRGAVSTAGGWVSPVLSLGILQDQLLWVLTPCCSASPKLSSPWMGPALLWTGGSFNSTAKAPSFLGSCCPYKCICSDSLWVVVPTLPWYHILL